VGHSKTPGGWPGDNGSWRGFLACGRAKCTLRAAATPGGGKSRKQTAAAAPGLGLRRRRCGVGAGLQPLS
jgi:hypothetical protein